MQQGATKFRQWVHFTGQRVKNERVALLSGPRLCTRVLITLGCSKAGMIFTLVAPRLYLQLWLNVLGIRPVCDSKYVEKGAETVIICRGTL
jgi:hypothetical protein